jgi:uncharacterized membrane protein YhhN
MDPIRLGGVTWIALATGAVALAVLLWAEIAGRPAIRAVAKTSCSLSFVAVAISGGVHGWLPVLVTAGLAISVVGDVLLLSRSQGAFLGGLVAFLLAHVAYATAFAPSSSRPLLLLPVVAFAVASVLAWLWPRLGPMRLPVIAYCVVIGAMTWLALGVPRPLVRAGAVLFFLSDLLVARGRFVRPGKVNQLVGWPLYYAGQFLLALAAG